MELRILGSLVCMVFLTSYESTLAHGAEEAVRQTLVIGSSSEDPSPLLVNLTEKLRIVNGQDKSDLAFQVRSWCEHSTNANDVTFLLSVFRKGETKYNGYLTEAVIWGLEMLKDRRAIRPLADRLQELEVRGTEGEDLVGALNALAGADAVPIFLKVYAKKDWIIKTRICEAAAKIGVRAKALLPILVDTLELQGEDPMVRCAAATALGRLEDARAIPVLKRAVRNGDENENVKTSAVNSLVRLNDRSLAPFLKKELLKTKLVNSFHQAAFSALQTWTLIGDLPPTVQKKVEESFRGD